MAAEPPPHQQHCTSTTICRMQDGTIIVSERWDNARGSLVVEYEEYVRAICGSCSIGHGNGAELFFNTLIRLQLNPINIHPRRHQGPSLIPTVPAFLDRTGKHRCAR